MILKTDCDAACRRCNTPIRKLPGTPLVCSACVRKSVSKTFFATLILVIVLSAAQLLVSGCDPYGGASFAKKAKVGVPPLAPILVPHRPYISGDAGIDRSSSDYPSVFFTQAKQAIADSIDNLVRPNEDGAIITLFWLSDNSFNYTETFLTIVIPPLPADSPQPKLDPYPPPSGNMYHDSQVRNQIDADNAATIQRWQQSLADHHTQLEQVKKQVKALTDRLRRKNPSIDNVATDIHGGLVRSSLRMRHARAGEKIVMLATDMAENTSTQVTPDLSLRGVRVVFLTPCAQNANDCEQSMRYWQQVILASGGRSVAFLDPTEVQTQQTLFSPA